MTATGIESAACEVSVVMPMRDGQAYVEQALRSILQENSVRLEVVVVDDGSTDRSREIVQAIDDPRIRLLDGPRQGISACLNAAIAAARGAVIMRCDADDLYPAGRILRQVSWLADHPEYDAVASAFSTIDGDGQLVARVGKRGNAAWEPIHDELRRGITRTHLCTFAIRSEAFARVGFFRPYFETAEDLDFQLRLGEVCQVAYQPVDSYFYRLHGASITHSRSSERRTFFDRMAVQFQRERLSTGHDPLMHGTPPPPPEHGKAKPVASVGMHMHHLLIGQSWRDLGEGRPWHGVSRAWRALRAHPFYLPGWINFAKILSRVVFPK